MDTAFNNQGAPRPQPLRRLAMAIETKDQTQDYYDSFFDYELEWYELEWYGLEDVEDNEIESEDR